MRFQNSKACVSVGGSRCNVYVKNWEEEYLECYRSLISVWGGGGTRDREGGKKTKTQP